MRMVVRGMSKDTVRLEEYTGVIQNKLLAVWQSPDTVTAWLPTEFLLSQYITRILVTGRSSPLSTAMTSDSSWTQVWRSPGGKEWACLIGVLQHMPGPILLVVGPDMQMTAKLVGSLQGVRSMPNVTVVVLRAPGLSGGGWVGEPADQVFFPVIDGATTRTTSLVAAMQEWSGKAAPKSLDFKTLLPQLAAQGYALTVADGVWHWYKPSDSEPMATLTVAQIARQIQILGTVLEKQMV
jgi:hypothetical protein